jgi:hypothetical protein
MIPDIYVRKRRSLGLDFEKSAPLATWKTNHIQIAAARSGLSYCRPKKTQLIKLRAHELVTRAENLPV